MLNESASSLNDRPVLRSPMLYTPDNDDGRRNQIRALVEMVLLIDRETFEDSDHLLADDAALLQAQGSRLIATFEGRLLTDSETAYETLDNLFLPDNLLPVFREVKGKHVVHVLLGRINPQPRPWWPNLVLFIATLLSVLFVGTLLALSEIEQENRRLAQSILNNLPLELWRGLPYALSILLILGGHELGHYFAARRYNLAVTLPYFIPFPINGFGTLGAFIQLRQPMRNRKMLLDIGAAGPLVGLVISIPILLIGLATSHVGPIVPGGMVEGNSVLYALAKILTFGRFLPNGQVDVMVNQLAWAGWTGLFVTGLNLIPIGQLDGGHVLYSLIGDRARLLYFPLLFTLGALLFFADSGLWLMVILLILFGRIYAAPLDNITPLDRRRQIIAVVTLVVFALVFVPTPLTPIESRPALNSASLVVATGLSFVMSLRQRH
jgi:membrane-associated protease RseP (regulator of RpoE activity)